MMDESNKTCTALGLTDEKPCTAHATSTNGLFCAYHARICQALYKGYKRRNAALDRLVNSPPDYLANTKTKLANNDFTDVEDVKTLRLVHDHLFHRYALLDRVIKAREMHHKHFYSQNTDYGHAQFLNSLITHRLTVLKALERIEMRNVVLVYEDAEWVQWTRDCHETEQEQQLAEQKKIKREAALSQRQAKLLEHRVKAMQAKEHARQQEAFLEQAYLERLADSDDEDWDPVEDVVVNDRLKFIDLIRSLLWLTPSSDATQVDGNAPAIPQPDDTPKSEKASSGAGPAASAAKKKKKKKKKTKAPAAQTSNAPSVNIETRDDMYKRLIEGMPIPHLEERVYITNNGPRSLKTRMPGIEPDETNRLLDEIEQIKMLLLCRLILGQPNLLPKALRASSIEDLLRNEDIPTTDLRDLALKLEQPNLQDLRDACADFFRDDSSDDAKEHDAEDDSEDEEEPVNSAPWFRHDKDTLPAKWKSKREKIMERSRRNVGHIIDTEQDVEQLISELERGGGLGADQIEYVPSRNQNGGKARSLRVTVCGKFIYHYPSEKSLSRKGWLHFSILAKDFNAHKATELCRSWNEYFDLTMLISMGYFPSPAWLEVIHSETYYRLSQFGFLTFFEFTDGAQHSFEQTLPTPGPGGRQLQMGMQFRSFLGGQLDRNSDVSRRFIQYMTMNPLHALILVRDGKTGAILTQPPKDEMWLIREKHDMDSASRVEWNVLTRVDKEFLLDMERKRRYRLNFVDYYDVFIWQRDVEEPFSELYGHILQTLCKAHRIHESPDAFRLLHHLQKTLTSTKLGGRVRDIQEGEDVPSIYEDLLTGNIRLEYTETDRHGTSRRVTGVPDQLKYDEADEAEDAILFPEEKAAPAHIEVKKARRFKQMRSEMLDFEEGRIDHFFEKFVAGYDPELDLKTDAEQDGELDSDWESEQDESLKDSKIDSDKAKAFESAHDQIEQRLAKFTKDSYMDYVRIGILHKNIPSSKSVKLNRVSQESHTIEISMGPAPPRDDIDRVFKLWLDRYRSKIFKNTWHQCDFEPGASRRWDEFIKLRKAAMGCIDMAIALTVPETRLFKAMRYHPRTTSSAYNDMQKASRMTALFFPQGKAFFDHPARAKHEESGIFQQKDRSKNVPYRRSVTSCVKRESEDPNFFTVMDKVWQETMRVGRVTLTEIPKDWHVPMRQRIAQLFKAGAIGPFCGNLRITSSAALMATENTSYGPELFIDMRQGGRKATLPAGTEASYNPYTTSIDSIRTTCTKYAADHPNARFSFLKLWSPTHFWPFVVPVETRQYLSFYDCKGRPWECKFVPKDLGLAEFYMHSDVMDRLKEHREYLGELAQVRIDVVVVMGEDEDDAFNRTCAATFALQAEPWILEVDYWRSFVNVDVEFLVGLDNGWWE